MSFESLVPHFLSFLDNYKYILLFLGVAIEGPILMVASGVFILSGFFNFAPAFIAITAGDLLGDVFWYYVGYFFAEPLIRKHGHFLKITPKMFEQAKGLFNKYHIKILLISKITLGFGMALATLMVAGATRVPFKKYMLLNLIGEIILVLILLTIGYFFGQMYFAISGALKIYFVVGVVIIFGIASYYFTKYTKHAIID